MPTSERISFRELLLSLFRDPWRKLIAIGLAVLLWHYLDAQVSQSEEIGLPLTVAHVAGELDTSQGARLFVRIDTSTYTVIAFEDPVTNTVCRDVRLYLTGAKRSIEAIDENPGYMVLCEPAPEQGELMASFTADDVRPMNPRFEGLIARMSPPRVVVRIGRNVDRQLVIGRAQVDFVAPPGAADLAERMVWEEAKYEPKIVALRGPAQTVASIDEHRRLFRFAPDPPPPGAVRLEAVMRAIDLGPTVRIVPDSVAIEVPIRVEPRIFRLPDVPVLLHEPEPLRGRFKLRRDTADVEIEAFRTLEAILSGLGPDERREWARENAYLVASLPSDAVDSDIVTDPRLVIRDYYERVDFRMTVRPIVHFDLKNP